MIEVLQAGMQTSIQDLGRLGYRRYGVPVSGAMDQQAFKWANALVNNPAQTACLEMTLVGPDLRFKLSCQLAITGATFQPKLNGQPLPMNKVVAIKPEDILSVGAVQKGMFAYLAIAGGFEVKKVLGSASAFAGIGMATPLQIGATLSMRHPVASSINSNASIRLPQLGDLLAPVEVLVGPEFDQLSAKVQQHLLEGSFTVSNAISRMGYRLDTTVSLQAEEIITSAVQPGTVQLTPSGKLIVLMRDAQTTGGYARVFHLTPEALNQFAQKSPGSTFRFNRLG